MSASIHLSIMYAVDGEFTDPSGEWRLANRAEWKAHAYPDGDVIASVTVYDAEYNNQTWFPWTTDAIPGWVPQAPEWFTTVVAEMETEVTS